MGTTKAGTLTVDISLGLHMKIGHTILVIKKQFFPPVDLSLQKIQEGYVINSVTHDYRRCWTVLEVEETKEPSGKNWLLEMGEFDV